MRGVLKFDSYYSVAGQPSAGEIREIAQQGYRAVVNLRSAADQDRAFSVAEEGRAVERSGMVYRNIPVSRDNISAEDVDRFRDEMSRMATPVLVHCASGELAGALVAAYRGVGRGVSGPQAVDEAKEIGFGWTIPELSEFVREYVDRTRNLKKIVSES